MNILTTIGMGLAKNSCAVYGAGVNNKYVAFSC